MSDKPLSRPVRGGTIDTTAEDTGKFPFEAWEFDPPNLAAPRLILRPPWVLYGNGIGLTTAITGTAAVLAAANTVLLAGQIGYETDTKYFKIGDGTTAYNSLSYQFKQVLYSGDVAYTPTFTGFGTVTTQSFFWTRVGNRIKVMGRFTAGTPTAVEARISLPGSLTSDGALATVRMVCGTLITDGGGGPSTTIFGFACMIEPSVGYITLGRQQSTAPAITKINGSAFGVGDLISVQFELPVATWNV